MTAAILQFNQHIRQTHTNNSQSASNNQSDYIDTPMTKEYHQIMIDLLNTEHPFRAVRLATEFNRENGFELIPVGMIRKWKKELSFLVNQNVEIGFVEIKFENSQIDFPQNEILNIDFPQIKMLELEKGYKELLKINN